VPYAYIEFYVRQTSKPGGKSSTGRQVGILLKTGVTLAETWTPAVAQDETGRTDPFLSLGPNHSTWDDSGPRDTVGLLHLFVGKGVGSCFNMPHALSIMWSNESERM
jgi:hypothetical protein